MRFHALAVLPLLLPGTAMAQRGATETWPALHVYWQPAERQRSFLDLSLSAEREGTKREGTVGFFQDYLRLPRAFARVGYSATFSLRDASYRESRFVGEVNLGYALSRTLRLVNRVRSELRWVNGAYSYRLRERVHVQRTTRADHVPRSRPYATLEAYYDSRYDTIARVGGRVGTELRLRGSDFFDVYLARQNNSRGLPPYVNALGLTLRLTYR